MRAGDIGRQGQRAGLAQTCVERLARVAEAQGHGPAFLDRLHGGGKIGRALDAQRIARTQAAGIAGQRVPGAIRQRAIQRDANSGGTSPRGPVGRG